MQPTSHNWSQRTSRKLKMKKVGFWLTNYPIIGTKWVFRNKMDELGNVIRNKARLVAQGYNQEKCIDFDETFTPVAS